MFTLPYFICLLCFTFCFVPWTLMISQVDKEIKWLAVVRQAEFEMEHCAQIQASYHNIVSAYKYLSHRVLPEVKPNLLRAKDHYLNLLSSSFVSAYCLHPVIPYLKAKAYKEKNSKLSPFWPNWVVRFY